MKVYGYQRIFHPSLPYRFPLLLKTEQNKYFKGIAFQIKNTLLNHLDRYEGVPSLYQRINYPIKTPKIELNPCYLYVPTKSTESRLEDAIKLYLTPPEREVLFTSDLWLDYLREREPKLTQEFPKLFST